MEKVKVKQLDFYTAELIEIYDSVEECAYDNFLHKSTLNRALRNNNGFMKTKKLRFEYAKPNVKEVVFGKVKG